jgi:hypothetical protein
MKNIFHFSYFGPDYRGFAVSIWGRYIGDCVEYELLGRNTV